MELHALHCFPAVSCTLHKTLIRTPSKMTNVVYNLKQMTHLRYIFNQSVSGITPFLLCDLWIKVAVENADCKMFN